MREDGKMNKRHQNSSKFAQHAEGSTKSYDEDMDKMSTMGQARSSKAMSDYADSTIDGGVGLVVAGGGGPGVSPRVSNTGRIIDGRVIGVGGRHKHKHIENNSGHHPAYTGDDDDEEDDDDNDNQDCLRGSKSGRSSRIFRWWSDVASRVSRSASSLLNQHSPNLNDILDGTEVVAHPTARRVDDVVSGAEDSIPEQHDNAIAGIVGPILSNIMEDGGTNDKEQEIFALREEVAMLKKKMQQLEEEKRGSDEMEQSNSHFNPLLQLNGGIQHNAPLAPTTDNISDIPTITPVQMLRPDEISRYSRQLLLNDGFGVSGQKQLLSSSILVIGAGGIGSTVLMYLAAAGVGHITVVDYDCVEMSNLHRQVIHKDENAGKSYDEVGMNKAVSAKQAMLDLNPALSCTALAVMISTENALDLISKHDVVVDACDNPQTRYLLNDACILAGKGLVSGSAMGTEGQLTVYNYQQPATTESDHPKKRSACYRCLYPKPNVAEGCKSCSDNGVLGMVPGAIGIFQAVETIKVVTGIGSIMHDRLLMYDSLHCSFLNIKKPPARPKCAVCSPVATIKSMKDSQESLENVRGPSVCAMPTPGTLSAEQNISCEKYNEVRTSGQPHVLLDVRVQRQFEMCSLEGSINFPLEQLQEKLDLVKEISKGELPVYCLCRRGIASAEATRIIQKSMEDGDAKGVHSVYNIAGGLNSWVQMVDSEFPQY